MNISAILAVTLPEKLDAMVTILNQLPGVEVHHIEQDSGRLILTQEAESIDDEINGLKTIKKLPGIIMADMVQHYFGEDEHSYPPELPEELNDQSEAVCVPAFLND